MPSLRGSHILIGITGGIAAYKIGFLVRELLKAGAQVKVMMTEAAARFVAPLTFSALTKNPVHTDLWASNQLSESEISTQHIELANWADIVLIAPASANTIAKLAYGISDNLVTIVTLATKHQIILSPTMDAEMYLNEVTQRNLVKLKERGFIVIPPVEGELASGLHGPGRLPEVDTIIQTVQQVLNGAAQDLKGKKILVTAGPTYEAIDPVRFIGNRSSGKMGFAVARAASQRGAKVVLITGPTQLETPRHVKRIDVESTQQMLSATHKNFKKTHAVIMAAAVADYTPVSVESNKIKKETKTKTMALKLQSTPDILATLGAKKGKTILVGFALETTHELRPAKEKLKKKNLDVIVLNSYSADNQVFGSDQNTVTIMDRKGKKDRLPKLSKIDVANKILDKVKMFL